MKKITIIAPKSFGYLDFLIKELQAHPETQAVYINYSSFHYQYKSVFDKFKNLLRKTFLKKNIKDIYKSQEIFRQVQALGKQDFIIVVRPDKLELDTIIALKKYTKNYYSFYFDAISNFPEKIALIPYFDTVFSYEKKDVEKYNLSFSTNFIYDFDTINQINPECKIFNISSYDERFGALEKMATYFKSKHLDYTIIIRKEKEEVSNLVTFTQEYMPLKDVKNYLLKADVLLDVQKENQHGLSFRVFESLGYKKKLITTNKDVVHYDFYNPNNMMVVDVHNIQIPDAFFKTPYQEISMDVLYKYTLAGWIENVFHIKPN
ncbi:hypothetical protein [Bizionia arctica]|uniref:Lipopolysaccharide biosynthesis protein n=1 Tax=Bizionia arctica TaxID=1495645 RepID=A0A917GUD0_9FLAO|nr:hypothetical protein [Bizionia arctica]GGG57467.1 hypothetical protein GCM10010976_30390 [Bizionia arctica]